MSEETKAFESGWAWGTGILALLATWAAAGVWTCRSADGTIETVYNWTANPSGSTIFGGSRVCTMTYYSSFTNPFWSYAVRIIVAFACWGAVASWLAWTRRKSRADHPTPHVP